MRFHSSIPGDLRRFLTAVITMFAVLAVIPGCSDPILPASTIESDEFPDPMLNVEGGVDRAMLGEVGSYNSDVPNAWYSLVYETTRDAGLSPPVASRSCGYAGVALYEALVGGMPEYQSLVGQLNDLLYVPSINPDFSYHWPTVANSALGRLLFGLYEEKPDQQAAIRALHDQYAQEFRHMLSEDTYRRSALHGRAVAKTILQWARHDGFDEWNNCAFEPPVGEGLWVPTPPAYAPPLQPCWGEMRTSATPDGSYSDPGPPPPYSEEPGSQFYTEADEVYTTVANLTEEQLTIALFWSDDPGLTGTPPGHSISICRQIIEQEGVMLDHAAEAYAKVGLAVHDAFINCWWTKFEYNLVRPVTYIRNLWEPDWLPPVNTPPFAEYTSGHSVQSGAAAQVMYDMWGDVPFTDHTHDYRGFDPRSFNSFFEFADEAAISRLYGGIHFRSAIDLGVEQGMLVGQAVTALAFHSGDGAPIASRLQK